MITEPPVTLPQDITVQTQTGTQTRDKIKRLVLHHCSIAEAAWHLFVSVVEQPYVWWSHRQTEADTTWHFHSYHGLVDKQEFDRRLQPRLTCKQPGASTDEKLRGKLFGFSYWNCSFLVTLHCCCSVEQDCHFQLFSFSKKLGFYWKWHLIIHKIKHF